MVDGEEFVSTSDGNSLETTSLSYRYKKNNQPFFSTQECVNPLGRSGSCINIRDCGPLIEILRRDGNSAGDFLRRSVCRFEGSNPIVCCPSGNGEFRNRSTTHTTIPTSQRDSTYFPIYPPVCGTPMANIEVPKVVGGVPAKLGAWPWMAALGYRSKTSSNKPRWLCAGSLVSSRHVITAAHCVHRLNDLYLVRLGDLDLDDSVPDGANPIDIPIEQVHEHPQYSDVQYTNDVAVLKLAWDVEFSDLIRPICLPLTEEIYNTDFTNALPFIAGWGSVYFRGPSASHLQQLQMPVVDTETCKTAFTRFKSTVIDERVLCAGYRRGGKDACKGDSGGPLMHPRHKVFYIIGIVSFGYRCAEPEIPGVYTRVTQFLDFIKSHLN
ncbi:venom protease-like [Fopius arisanus]|uniref:CLIP domain-containing serine protease n=1 Tax=Fopius arisanus TaxID=64838 RepID=A0A9R1TBW1_9HYME|nr:PREDICTED: venom protease-like [Fopius arisanus]